MIVVCEGCERRFHVDDARIPARGARVRCKRCKHRFRVHPPSGGEAEAGETSAPAAPPSGAGAPHDASGSRAPASGPGAASGPSPDDGDSSLDGLSGEQTLLGQSVPEGELRFVTDPPDAPGAGPERHAASAPSEEAWEFADSEVSSAAQAEEPEPAVQATAAVPPEDGESTLGQLHGVDPEHTMDPGAPIEDDPDAIERPLPGTGPDPAIFDLEATGGSLESAVGQGMDEGIEAAPPGEGMEPGAASGPAPEIGSAADWDRLAGEVPEGAGSPAATAGPEQTAPAGAFVLDDDDDEDLSFELDLPVAVPDAAAHARSVWLEHAGWALSLLLLLAVAQGSVRIEPVAPEVPPGRAEVGGLLADGVRGRFVENARSGHLFVVSGELRNVGARARRAEGRLQVVLLDAEDRPLPRPPAPLGTALAESAVRETPVGALALQEELRSHALAERSLAPGEAVPFHGVLAEVSEEAVRFRIERVPERRPGDAADSRDPTPAPAGALPAPG